MSQADAIDTAAQAVAENEAHTQIEDVQAETENTVTPVEDDLEAFAQADEPAEPAVEAVA